MKKLLPLLLVIFLMQNACKKDEKKDFVNDFSPTLTEEKNTAYSGDYFPFKIGYSWNWEGESKTAGSTTYTINGNSQSEKMDETPMPAYGDMNVVDDTTITLPSGRYNVLSTLETGNTNRYFQITDSSIIIRALKVSEMGQLIEVKNPVYLKNPLVVGDSWQTQPTVDLSQLTSMAQGAIENFDYTVNCKIFVLGNEDITWHNASTNTVALQERATMSGNMDINQQSATGTLSFNLTADIKLNLVKDVGIVKQVSIIKGSMTMTVAAPGMNMKVNINLTNSESTLTLSSYDLTEGLVKNAPALKSTNATLLKKSANNKVLNEQIDIALSIIDKLMKASTI